MREAIVTEVGRMRTRFTTAPSPAGATLASVAMRVPEGRVRSAELAPLLGVEEDWILARTGVRERRIAADGERLTPLAGAAAHDALAAASVDPADVDLVLVATVTADEVMPNAAPLVAGEIGATHAAAIDVGAACTGFLSALALGTAWLEAGRARTVVVVGADIMSRLVKPDDRGTRSVFGDGAAACVLRAVDAPGRIGPILMGCDPGASHLVTATREPASMHMEGQETYRHAVMHLVEVTRSSCEAAGLTPDDIDLFVYHQANARILRAVGERLRLDPARVVNSIERYGNTSAASIPIALAEADRDGRLTPGTKVLLGAFGAGMTWGGVVVEWGAA
jgi:3-oxoacyl-[acyl-carrier-protein] synthase III